MKKLEIKIENLGLSDLNSFFILFKEIIENDFPFPPYVKRIHLTKNFNKNYFKKRLASKDIPILLAKADNKVVAFIVPSDDFGGVIRILWLGVKKDFRGKKIASTLIHRLERWAFDHHFHCIYLYTETQDNIKFYKKLGFYLCRTSERSLVWCQRASSSKKPPKTIRLVFSKEIVVP